MYKHRFPFVISAIQRILLTNLSLDNCDNSSAVAQQLPAASAKFVPQEISFGGWMTNPMFVSGQIHDGLRSCGERTLWRLEEHNLPPSCLRKLRLSALQCAFVGKGWLVTTFLSGDQWQTLRWQLKSLPSLWLTLTHSINLEGCTQSIKILHIESVYYEIAQIGNKSELPQINSSKTCQTN